jgi:chemotaxis protein histidine kinase CheA
LAEKNGSIRLPGCNDAQPMAKPTQRGNPMTKANPKKKSTPKKKENAKKAQREPKPAPQNEPSAATGHSASPKPDTPRQEEAVAASPQKPLIKPSRPKTREEILFLTFESDYRPIVPYAPSEKILPPNNPQPSDPGLETIRFRQFHWVEEEAAFRKAQAERMEAERIAKEKAEAERLEAERIAKEKAEAEKREAERIAREKAEAERVEAERIAREKAEAARLEAEKAEQKRKAEEQAKAELLAMTKKKEQESASVSVTYPTKCDNHQKKGDSVDKSIKFLIAGVAALLLLLIGVSASNMCTYIAKETPKGVEIWQGRFSPIGHKLLITLPGIKADAIHPNVVLPRKVVFPFICRYYLDKADQLIEQPGELDFPKIRALIHQAAPYADTEELKAAVNLRLNGLGQMVEIYKADVLIDKGTPISLQKAKDMLTKAGATAQTESQKKLIESRLSEIEAKMAQ